MGCFLFCLPIGSTYLECSERGRFALSPPSASSSLVSGKVKNLREANILDARKLANPSLRSLRVGQSKKHSYGVFFVLLSLLLVFSQYQKKADLT